MCSARRIRLQRAALCSRHPPHGKGPGNTRQGTPRWSVETGVKAPLNHLLVDSGLHSSFARMDGTVQRTGGWGHRLGDGTSLLTSPGVAGELPWTMPPQIQTLLRAACHAQARDVRRLYSSFFRYKTARVRAIAHVHLRDACPQPPGTLGAVKLTQIGAEGFRDRLQRQPAQVRTYGRGLPWYDQLGMQAAGRICTAVRTWAWSLGAQRPAPMKCIGGRGHDGLCATAVIHD